MPDRKARPAPNWNWKSTARPDRRRRPATARSTRPSTQSRRSSRTLRTLVLFSVGAVTEGTDAQAKTTVRLEENGKMVDGQGADADTIVASARAYIHALEQADGQAVCAPNRQLCPPDKTRRVSVFPRTPRPPPELYPQNPLPPVVGPLLGPYGVPVVVTPGAGAVSGDASAGETGAGGAPGPVMPKDRGSPEQAPSNASNARNPSNLGNAAKPDSPSSFGGLVGFGTRRSPVTVNLSIMALCDDPNAAVHRRIVTPMFLAGTEPSSAPLRNGGVGPHPRPTGQPRIQHCVLLGLRSHSSPRCSPLATGRRRRRLVRARRSIPSPFSTATRAHGV